MLLKVARSAAVSAAGDVDIAALQHQAFNLAFRHMPHDDAAHFGAAGHIVLIRLQNDDLIRRPAVEGERAGAGRICSQPCIPPVIIDLVGLQFLAVDHAGNDHGEAIEQQFRSRFTRKIDANRFFIRSTYQLVDVVGIVAHAPEVRCGRLVHLQKAAERINHIGRGHRVTGGEIRLAKMKGDAFLIRFPALGELRRNLAGTVHRDQAIIKIGHDFVGFCLGGLMGVE
ncbi:UNVERIFIED_ORG: hypothetical protein QE434_000226 [Rhizobium sp. SORGH_AS 755]|nr:hypothetical protein [Rhizobium sp. SORGH_AS_0755]